MVMGISDLAVYRWPVYGSLVPLALDILALNDHAFAHVTGDHFTLYVSASIGAGSSLHSVAQTR